jgi:hypothetical protein
MHLRICAALLLAFAAAGCANHVRFENEVRDHESREVASAATRIAAPPSLAQPYLELAVSSEETVSVRRRETLVKLDEETPWRASEELWEVPAGLVAIPFFLAMRASDKLCLGLIPDDTFNHGLDWGFAALNPALNVESSERVEGREIARKTTELGRVEEHDSRALGDVQIAAAIPGHPTVLFASDAGGHARVELLRLVPDDLHAAPRKIRIAVAGDGVRAGETIEVPIAHPIAERLAAAVRERQRLRSAGISAEAAARGLVALDTLGFQESALALEQELRDRQQRNAAWLSRLDLALQLD